MKYVGLLIDIKQDSYGKLVDILLPKDNGHIKSQLFHWWHNHPRLGGSLPALKHHWAAGGGKQPSAE